MLSLLRRFMPPIASYRIDLYEHEGVLLRLKLTIKLADESILYVKEYRFQDESRKYSFHWVDSDGFLLVRWDNAEHWPEISTFPHHKHVGTNELPYPSTEITLDAVLQVIAGLCS